MWIAALLVGLGVLGSTVDAFITGPTMTPPAPSNLIPVESKTAPADSMRLAPWIIGREASAATVLMSSKQPEGKRTRRRSKRKRESDSTDQPAVAMRDLGLDDLIEDERKTQLPRLEDLRAARSGATATTPRSSGDDGGKGGEGPRLLLPREIEEMKRKEKATVEVQGAPSYFPLMTRITWGAIITMVVVEVVVHSPLVNLPGNTGIPMP